MSFESSLRTAIVTAPIAYRHARRIIDVLDAPPSPRRDRLLARMRHRAADYLEVDAEGIDWSTVQWASIILDIVKLLLTVITLFGESQMSLMQSCPPEHSDALQAALDLVPSQHATSVQDILSKLIGLVPWGKLPALVPFILAEVTSPSEANLQALFAAILAAFTA